MIHHNAVRLASLLLGTLTCVGASADLIGYYEFEGNALDSSGNGNHGTLSATAPTVTAAGFDGSGYQFGSGGANTFITVPIDINPGVLPQVTFGGWFNADVADLVIRGVISHDDGGFDRTITIDTRNGDGTADWQLFAGNTFPFAGAAGAVVPGDWVFVAASYDATGDSCFFLSGLYGCTSSQPGGSIRTDTTIGRNPGFDLPFIGRADNVFFFDEALTEDELNRIFENGIRLDVAEPGTTATFALGALALGLARRRRR